MPPGTQLTFYPDWVSRVRVYPAALLKIPGPGPGTRGRGTHGPMSPKFQAACSCLLNIAIGIEHQTTSGTKSHHSTQQKASKLTRIDI